MDQISLQRARVLAAVVAMLPVPPAPESVGLVSPLGSGFRDPSSPRRAVRMVFNGSP